MTKERLEEILKENTDTWKCHFAIQGRLKKVVTDSMVQAVNEAIVEAHDIYWDGVTSGSNRTSVTLRKILNLKIKD